MLYFLISEQQVESIERVSETSESHQGYSWPKRAGQYMTLLLCFQG